MTEETTFVDFAWNQGPRLAVVPPDQYTVRITKASIKTGTSEKGNDYEALNVILEIEGHPTALDIFHTVWYKNSGSSEKQAIRAANDLEDFFVGFDYDVPGIDVHAMVGLTADVILGVRDGNSGPENYIKGFLKKVDR